MAIYSASQITSNVTTATACFEIRTTATDRAYALELGMFNTTATSANVGIGRPAAIGITPGGTVTVLAEDFAAPAGTVVTALSWGTGPTVPVNFFRKFTFPAAIGGGVIYTFPRGLVIPISGSIIIWNLSTMQLINAHVVVDE